MGTKLLFVFGVLALFESGFAMPGRLRRDTEGMMQLTSDVVRTLMALFSAEDLQVTPENIPKLMALMHQGHLTDEQKRRLAEALVASNEVKEVKRKLGAGEKLTHAEEPLAWALSVTPDGFTEAEKAEFEKQRADDLPEIDLEEVSDTTISELVKKLDDNSGALPTEEEQRNLIQEAEDLSRAELFKLAKLVEITEDQKTKLLQMISAQELLGEEDAKRFWALKQKLDVPEGTVPTRETLLSKAETMLSKLSTNDTNALLAKMVDPTVMTLTDSELNQIVAIQKTMDFTQEQREAFAKRLLPTITEEMFTKIKIAIVYQDDRPIVMKYIRVLIKANKLSPKVLERMAGAGIMPNGETISEAFKDGVEIPDSLGLTAEQKTIIKEIGSKLGESLDFDDLNAEDLLKMIMAFESMTEEDRNLIANLESRASTLTEEQIQMMKPYILGKIPTEVLIAAHDAMSAPMKEVFCSLGVTGREGSELYLKLKEICTYDLLAKTKDMEEGERKRLIQRVLEANGDKPELDGEDLAEMAESNLIDKEVLERATPEALKQNEAAIAAAVANGEGKHVAAKLRRATGGMAGTTEDELKKLTGVPLLPTDIREMGDEVVAKGSKEVLNGLDEDDDAVRNEIAKKIEKTLGEDRNAADDDKLANFMQAGRTDVLEDLTPEKMKSVIKKMAGRKLTKEAETDIVKAIESLEEFSDPSLITAEKLTEMKADYGELMTKMSQAFVKRLSKDALLESVMDGLTEDVDDMDEPLAREIGKAAKDMELNKANLTKLGSAVVSALPSATMEDITVETAKDPEVVSMFKEAADKMPPVNKKKYLSKIQSVLGSEVSLCTIGELCQEVTLEEANAWNTYIIQDILDAEDCELDCKPAILSVLAKKMVAKLGDVNNYDDKTRSKLSILIAQLPDDVIAELPVTEESAGQVAKMLRNKNLNDNKRESMMNKLKDVFKNNKATSAAAVADIAPAFEIFDVDALDEYVDGSVCGEAVEGLTQMDMENVEETRLRGMSKWSIECITGSTSGAIDSEAATSLGSLICFMPPERVADLTQAAVDDTIDKIKLCIDQEAFKAKYMAGMPALSEMTDEDVAKMSSFLSDMALSDIDKINTAALSKNLVDVTTAQEARLEKQMEREKRLGEDENFEATKEKEVKVAQKLIEARKEVNQAARAKRSSEIPMECSDVKDTGRMAIAFTPEELSGLSDEVILDCLTTLGGDIDWSMEQKASLAARLKAVGVHGSDLTQWSSEQMVDAGTMMGGFSETELGQFPWGLDELAAHGKPPASWIPAQLAAVATKWLSSAKSDDASTITALELSVIGHFACGLTAAQINQIPNTVYQEAVGDVGEAEGCSYEQAMAFATKAKALYSDVDTWSTDTILSINRVLAGLSGTEFSSISNSDLGEIHPDVIAILPPNTLSGLTGEKIGALTKSQANAVTADQYQAFNPSQREALEAIIGKKFTSDNSAGAKQMSLISGILVILVTIGMM